VWALGLASWQLAWALGSGWALESGSSQLGWALALGWGSWGVGAAVESGSRSSLLGWALESGSRSWLLGSGFWQLALESGSRSWLLGLASQSALKSLPERATIDLWTSSAELMLESESCLKLPWTDSWL